MAENTVRRALIGKVLSDKRNKTRTVEIRSSSRHPQYGKVVSKITKCQVHDEMNESKEGDLVEICETRPISKTKTWKLVRVVEQARII
ncbi:MAG TPA: 30S ribosomal protein S17 [Gammaproteobacteria bacterium]|nr:30S ribosomal protein S17 [Gammaproteobacteria bacterium]